MHTAGAGEVGDMVREREIKIKSNFWIENRDIRGECRGRRVSVWCIEESGIFLIWSGRPIMTNPVMEGLKGKEVGRHPIRDLDYPH